MCVADIDLPESAMGHSQYTERITMPDFDTLTQRLQPSSQSGKFWKLCHGFSSLYVIDLIYKFLLSNLINKFIYIYILYTEYM